LPVRRVLDVASNVPRNGLFHSAQSLKYSFDTPKTSPAKNRCLFACHSHWMPTSLGKFHRRKAPNRGKTPNI
jgi:hypothetical protein